MSILYAWILMLSISLIIGARLDGDCTNNVPCEGVGTHCPDGKCRCDTPWYRPCNSSCELSTQFVYEGDKCLAPANCIGNANCIDGKCRCKQDYTAKNGVCLTNLNVACINHTECWSNYCLGLQCKCGPGYELDESSTICRRKLVKIYNTWNEANAANAFCADDSSCIDIVATCYNDSANPTSKFCKCPIGYQIKDNSDNKQCDPIEGKYLSPLDSVPSDYGQCGYCKDDNAACINAGSQRTCWCRSGYVNRGNKCEKEQRTGSLLIFPSSTDLETHNFTAGCFDGTNQIVNKLCVCAPGYEFVDKNQPCKKIQRNWEKDIFEYGVCTRINSRDEANGENGVCPEPLKCEVRNDKHVCSCGKDKFRDLDDPTQCVYYIGNVTSSTNDKCPTKNSQLNNRTRVCECAIGYKAANANRQCELKLSSESFQSSCNSDRSNDSICQNLFGKKALLCTIGECRCSGNDSFANIDRTQCYAPVNRSLVLPRENCPLNSTFNGASCECDDSYHPSANLRECVRSTAQLLEYTGPSRNTNSDLTTADCRALFTGPVEVYETGRCQCRNESFINDNKTGCWYRLDVTLPQTEDTAFCPPNSAGGGQICKCETGFTKDGNKCVPIAKRVYMNNDPTAINITGITSFDCVKLFGLGAIKSSNGDYCICLSYAYPVKSNTYCNFLINVTSNEFKNPENCPANTIVVPSGSDLTTCLCKPGYHASSNNQTCEPTNITLIGTDKMETANCVIFSNNDCIVNYGEQAFCKDEKCFCNRQLSFMNAAGKCESLSNYVFPGEHERSLYACDTEKDCGNKEKVTCDYLNQNSGYKVCKCADDSFLDPKLQTCVQNRCNCNEALHFECRDFVCKCKSGYYQNGSICIEYKSKLQLYEQCDSKIFREVIANDSLVCNARCNRAECTFGYQSEDSRCVRYQLGKDKCVHQEQICEGIDKKSECYRDENQCLCKPSYYQSDNTCVRGVGFVCVNNEDCGVGICKGKRCDCDEGQQIEEMTDVYGRPIKRCTNGIDRIRFNPVLLLLFVLARVFFL